MDANLSQGVNRFPLAQRSVPAIDRRAGMKARLEGDDPLRKGIPIRHLHDPHGSALLKDPLHQPAGGEGGIVGVGRDDQRPYWRERQQRRLLSRYGRDGHDRGWKQQRRDKDRSKDHRGA